MINLPEFFTLEYSNDASFNDTPQAEGWIPAYTKACLNEVIGLTFADTTPINEYYDNLEQVFEDGYVYEYSIKLGAFVNINGEWSLEQTFDSMNDAYTDLRQFSMDETYDFIYRPYVLITVKIPERR